MGDPDAKLAELLLQETNLDLSCVDNFGQTPLGRAAENGSLPLVKLLQQPGLHVSPQCADAVPPLGQHVVQDNLPW